MFNITLADFLRYLRIVIQWGASATGTLAFVNGSTGQMIIAAIIAIVTLVWTAYATRIAAKINELVGAQVITAQVGEKMKDVATDPTTVVSKVEVKPTPAPAT